MKPTSIVIAEVIGSLIGLALRYGVIVLVVVLVLRWLGVIS